MHHIKPPPATPTPESPEAGAVASEAGGSISQLEEGFRRKSSSLPPMEVGGPRPPILDVVRNDSWKLKSVGKDGVGKWQPFETSSDSPGDGIEHFPASSTGRNGSSESNLNLGDAGRGNSNRVSSGGLSGANGGHGGNIPITDGVTKQTKVDDGGEKGGGEAEEDEMEDKDSAQRILIGWMQARQRDFVTLISLGCVTVTFVEYLKGGVSSTLGTAVTLIPVTVQLLLLRDIFVRWEERQARLRVEEQTLRDQATGKIDTLAAGSKGTSCMGGVAEAGQGQGGCNAGSADAGGGQTWAGGPVDGGVNAKRPLGYANSVGSSDSSNTPPNATAAPRGRRSGSDPAHGSQGSSNEDSSSNGLGRRSSEDNLANLLETPFQKSVRIIGYVSENISDPVLRGQLRRVVKLLSDPDALHIVKEASIRRVTMDVGTRSYIENVLQTPVKVASESRNWRKLRTGMFVVRALAKEAAEHAKHASSGGKTSEDQDPAGAADGPGQHLAYAGSTSNQTELDDLLDDMTSRDGGAEGPGDPFRSKRQNSTASDERGWDEDDNNTFDQLNRGIIQGQQLVAKIMSRGDVRRDPDRMSVRELRNLAPDSKMPDKIMEHPAGEEPFSEEKNPSKMKHIPRLSILEEARMDEVAALMTDGGFLKWDFNVFNLEERSGGHSLWFAAMSTFFHYNLVGAFGLSVERLSQMFMCVEATYCYDPKQPNIYHTHVHAADVTLTVAHFLSVDVISNTVRGTHGFALVMAAIMHDYRHPGVNNGYLVRDLDPLALTYNDSSVLENFHAAEGFKMMLDQTFDIFKGWKPEDIKFFRHAYVKCILATDLALSLEYISKFQSLSSNAASRDTANTSTPSGTNNAANGGGGVGKVKPPTNATESIQTQILLLQMVLKVSDVAHPCKPWEIHSKWSELVTQEFFAQGDKELARGLSVSPLCDRRDQNLPKSQCDFIDFIVRPCVAIFSGYCNVTTWNNQLESNFRAWRALQEENGSALRSPSPSSKRRSLR